MLYSELSFHNALNNALENNLMKYWSIQGCVRRVDWQFVTDVFRNVWNVSKYLQNLQGVTSQKTWIFSTTAVRTSNIALWHLPRRSVASGCSDTVGFSRRTRWIYSEPTGNINEGVNLTPFIALVLIINRSNINGCNKNKLLLIQSHVCMGITAV